jgi:murein DD-endopeptidase MepM/ murein hydrolase activator NlpD
VTLITTGLRAGQKRNHSGSLGVFMSFDVSSKSMSKFAKVKQMFRGRELFIHDGAAMRRFHISARAQMQAVGAAALLAVAGTISVGQLAISSFSLTDSASAASAREAEIAAMESKLAALQSDVATVKTAARDHAKRLEARHAALAALLKGDVDDKTMAAMLPAIPYHGGAASSVETAFAAVDQQQAAMAAALTSSTDARYAQKAGLVSSLGLNPAGLGGMGGPYEPVTEVATGAPGKADPQFRALFDSWKRLDRLETSMISIPSQKPVDSVSVNSGFGVRSDPFRGGRAMHAGVDIPGPIGTPIYATADGIVGRTGWIGGYGNMIELEHGKAIQTRYGHLSAINVAPGTRVKRGQLIGLMGSTGRSTGSHLHYEVRLDGRAVNPIPFLRTADYLLAMQKRTDSVALGGPETGTAKR